MTSERILRGFNPRPSILSFERLKPLREPCGEF